MTDIFLFGRFVLARAKISAALSDTAPVQTRFTTGKVCRCCCYRPLPILLSFKMFFTGLVAYLIPTLFPPPTPGARLGNSSFVCMFITQRDTLVACVCVFRCVYTVVKSLVKFSSTLVSPSLLFSFSNLLQIIFFVACDDARTFSATPIVYISTAYNNNRQRDNVRHRGKKVERYFYHYFVVLHPSGSYWDDAAVLF